MGCGHEIKVYHAFLPGQSKYGRADREIRESVDSAWLWNPGNPPYELSGCAETTTVSLRPVYAIPVLLAVSLSAAELPGPLDFTGQVEILSRMMGGETGRYRATVIDDFEGERIWKPYAAGAQLDEVQFLKMKPEHPAFEDEGALCRVSGDEKSLFLHFAFQNPGKEQFIIRPASPIRLAAQPVRISFWVHSSRYLHTMSLLLKNANGLEIRVPAGRLDFKGWRRIELDLPVQMHERGRRLERRYSSQFIGIAIESNPHEPAGQTALSIDQMILLSDYADFRYPGADIQDTWTNEVPND